MKKENLQLLTTAYKTQKKGAGDEEIYVINQESPIAEQVKNAQFALNDETGTFELDYEIMARACLLMADNAEQITDKTDYEEWEELASDCASVYTGERLSYLTINNQQEITDILKEYESIDIADACAVWFERQVTRAMELISKHVLNEK